MARRSRTPTKVVILAASAGVAAACGLDVVGQAGGSGQGSNDAGLPGDALASATDAAAEMEETCPSAALQRGAPWPMIGGCVSHPGRTVHRGPKQEPKIVWRIAVKNRESQVVIGADDTVYIPADTDGVVAFGPDGGPRSFASAGTGSSNNVTNTPAIGADGTLYFGAEKDVVALRQDGTYWRIDTNGEVETSPLLDEDGTVYSGSFSDRIFAIAPDGGRRWQNDLRSDVWASAAMGKSGDIYVGASDQLFALQREDGGARWSFRTNGDIRSSPVVADDGTIYIGTTGARLHAVHPDGGEKWTVLAKGNFGWQQLPALGKDGTVYAPASGYLAAVDPVDGGVRWERAMNTNLRTSVVVDRDGDLYVGGDNRMFGITASGDELWHLDINANPTGFAIGRDATIYVTCNNDSLIALHE